MVEARVYQCPVCGAFARDGERTCRHCSTLLATLRCAHCFGLNFPDDLHCHGCGHELGLVPQQDVSEQACPDCHIPLQAFAADTGRLHACQRCGGQMVTHGLLRALLEQREALGRAVPSAPADVPRGNPLDSPLRYRACPTCSSMMNRKNFGGTSGIIVDVCSLHGTFFDEGELSRVLEFVRRGGLARAKAALQNSAGASPKPSRGGLIDQTPGIDTVSGHGLGVVDNLVDLVSFLVDVLRHH
jgi:Zn-finger nucleic acid-binding protein